MTIRDFADNLFDTGSIAFAAIRDLLQNLLRRGSIAFRWYRSIVAWLAISSFAALFLNLAVAGSANAGSGEGVAAWWLMLRIAWIVLFSLLLLSLTPVAIAYRLLVPNALQQKAEAWLRWTVGLLVAQLVTAVAIYALWPHLDPRRIPLLVLLSFLLGIVGGWKLNVRVLRIGLATAYACVLIASLCPGTVSNLWDRWSAPRRVAISAAGLENGEIEFFRPNGEPKMWCWSDSTGAIECFDAPGAHPLWRESLEPVTPQLVAQLVARARVASPRRLTLTREQLERGEHPLFDAQNLPTVWYHRCVDGSFELFDRPGYHPVRGTALRPVDATVVEQILGSLVRSHDTTGVTTAEGAPWPAGDPRRRTAPKNPSVVLDDSTGTVQNAEPLLPVRKDATPIPPDGRAGTIHNVDPVLPMPKDAVPVPPDGRSGKVRRPQEPPLVRPNHADHRE